MRGDLHDSYVISEVRGDGLSSQRSCPHKTCMRETAAASRVRCESRGFKQYSLKISHFQTRRLSSLVSELFSSSVFLSSV